MCVPDTESSFASLLCADLGELGGIDPYDSDLPMLRHGSVFV